MSSAHVTLSSVACPTLQCFFHINSHGKIFGKKVTEHKMCVLFVFTTLSPTFLILRRSRRHIIVYLRRYSCKLINHYA